MGSIINSYTPHYALKIMTFWSMKKVSLIFINSFKMALLDPKYLIIEMLKDTKISKF